MRFIQINLQNYIFMKNNDLNRKPSITNKKFGFTQWCLTFFLVITLISEYNNHDYSLISQILFPILMFFISLGISKNNYTRFVLSILFSLMSFCFFGEKTIVSFIISFVSGLGTYLIYLLISKRGQIKDSNS